MVKKYKRTKNQKQTNKLQVHPAEAGREHVPLSAGALERHSHFLGRASWTGYRPPHRAIIS